MRNIKIREMMTPIDEYISVRESDTLYDVFNLLGNKTAAPGIVHRDLIVVDASGGIKGKITMIDLFRALEPNYKYLESLSSGGTLTKESILDAVRKYDLWLEPVRDLCERGRGVRVSDVMHIPSHDEYVDENDSLEIALHRYVMGGHQPLLVKNGKKVSGILRFEDLFEFVKDHMLTCHLAA